MSSVTENGILDKKDFESFKERTVASKFRHQLFLGIGGATVFGLVGAFGKALLDIALLGSAGAGLAWAGLAATAVVGLGCIYLGSKFLSESILMDQDFQAKKIALATDVSRAQALVPDSPTRPVHTTPPGMAIQRQQELGDPEDSQGHDKIWAESVQRRDATAVAPKAKTESWEQVLEAAENSPTISQRIH
ncbi:MAG: hypothetical protein J0M34_06880 [Alphaproteobacteria bacterium]|nr:hypothetical protein [Alphaproteobacteria bacterium]